MLDFRVYTFLTVCKYMNYTKAARELCITQPAVSQHIKHLEDSFGTTFFTYEGKILSLTKSGQMFLRVAETFAADETILRRRIEAIKESCDESWSFTFGATFTVAEYSLKNKLPVFIKNNPDIRLNMRVANTASLLKDLENGKIDFAIVEGHLPGTRFDNIVFSTEEFVPVAASGHRFKKKPETVYDILEEELLLREPGSGTREIFENILAFLNLDIADFKNYTLISTMTGIVELVRQDCGISFLYKTAVSEYIDSGEIEVIPIVNLSFQHNFSFIWNKGSVYEEQFKRICKELKK